MQEEDDDIEHDYNIFHIPKFNDQGMKNLNKYITQSIINGRSFFPKILSITGWVPDLY